MVDSTDEKHLLIDLKGGSFQAFERLYNMYSGKLYNFIMRLSSGNQYMAEEVVQATFIRIWEVHEKVDPASSEGTEKVSLQLFKELNLHIACILFGYVQIFSTLMP